ncbi:hypothetical protein [Massilia glaciei]|uniref:hypothetical protein n=1 Tax=Massilia glaciei TaxID=1524097 RepID=UPI0011B21A37|nr:hypothetical protein [Massilia glaciei]
MRQQTASKVDCKDYAMRRMAAAIERTNNAASPATKTRASRWVAAWGLVYHGGTEFRAQQGVQNTRTWMNLVC